MKRTITLPDQETILSRLRHIEVPNYTGPLKLDELYYLIAQEADKEFDVSALVDMLVEKACRFVFEYYKETGNFDGTLEIFKLVDSYLTIYVHVLVDDSKFARRASEKIVI